MPLLGVRGGARDARAVLEDDVHVTVGEDTELLGHGALGDEVCARLVDLDACSSKVDTPLLWGGLR